MLSVNLSVHLSVTLMQYCVKTAKYDVEICSPAGSFSPLVFQSST